MCGGASPTSECRLAAGDDTYPQYRRARSGGAVCVDHLLESVARGIGGPEFPFLGGFFESVECGACLFVQRFPSRPELHGQLLDLGDEVGELTGHDLRGRYIRDIEVDHDVGVVAELSVTRCRLAVTRSGGRLLPAVGRLLPLASSVVAVRDSRVGSCFQAANLALVAQVAQYLTGVICTDVHSSS